MRLVDRLVVVVRVGPENLGLHTSVPLLLLGVGLTAVTDCLRLDVFVEGLTVRLQLHTCHVLHRLPRTHEAVHLTSLAVVVVRVHVRLAVALEIGEVRLPVWEGRQGEVSFVVPSDELLVEDLPLGGSQLPQVITILNDVGHDRLDLFHLWDLLRLQNHVVSLLDRPNDLGQRQLGGCELLEEFRGRVDAPDRLPLFDSLIEPFLDDLRCLLAEGQYFSLDF